jgi:hypothetical protein
MQDPGLVFDALDICPGLSILDMGCGFKKIGYTDLGYNYLSMFRLPESPHVINE